jgi:serine/threonine protein kinase/regulator of sirC expression with transglutaminase-like and TPR domain
MHEKSDSAPTLVVPAPPPAPLPATEATRKSRVAQLPVVPEPPAEEASALPTVGSTFLGFRLRAVLGRGAFGQVYLAEQGDLANRFVVLKVAPDIFGESQTLAQLQHTNIVPIYSIHRAGPLQAVCMPYFGATTLADVLSDAHVSQAQPASGQMVVQTVEQRKRSTLPLVESSRSSHPASDPAAPSVDGADLAPRRPAAALQQLARMTYVDAVLWIGERIADGLAYAHEQGILHHDLKPANILLTEDGQPMLLDFNLSEDTKRRTSTATALAGGTLPYMAPEHLEVFRDRSQRLDARSDIYSLGIILYELLAGQLPFPNYPRHSASTLATMIEDRHKPIPPLRDANTAVSPAVASLVDHCLHPAPARRYQSARALQEDLRRQRCDLPLRYAPERSVVERARKWVRRHPRLTSSTSVAAMFGAVVFTLALAFLLRGQQLGRLEAEQKLGRFRADARAVQFLLYSRHADRGQLEEGMRRCRDTLAQFAVLDDPQWDAAPAVRYLPEAEQARLHDEAGEMLFLLARATALHGQAYCAAETRDERWREAERLNQRAEASFGSERAPRALWEQRAELARRRGDEQRASELAAQAQDVPLRTARDRYLIAHQHAIRGNLRQALDLLQQVTHDDPCNFSAWFVRGNCCYDLLQDTSAIACFNACVTLRPEFHWTWFNRGLAHLRLKRYRQALADFDRVVRLNPDLAEGYVHRALAREGLQEYREAIADYTQALADPTASTRIYFLRSAARDKAGDQAGAQRDFDAGLATEPTDEMGWIARGNARRERDAKAALADYERALAINPRSFDALQNKAAILSDKFSDDAAALKVIERAVELYPESVLTRGGRGVLLARMGQRGTALEDARACLLLDSGAATQYQVACIYALTAKQHADDRLQALPLLSAALRAGFGLDFVDRDNDLDALREMPEFQRLVAAARALHAR